MPTLNLTTSGVLFVAGTIVATVIGLSLIVDAKMRHQIARYVTDGQAQALRIAALRLAEAHPGIQVQLDGAGNVLAIRADVSPEVDDHGLVDRIGALTGETATLFL